MPVIRTLLKVFFLPFLIIFGVTLLCFVKKIPPQIFTSDPLVLFGGYPWLGFLSNLGVLVWSAGAGISFFTAAALSRSNHPREHILFLNAGGAIATVLLLDDMFMLHEYVFEELLHIHQWITFSIYAAGMIWYLFRFRALILKNDPLLLFLSLVFFALSLACDVLMGTGESDWLAYAEDVPKAFAIVSWTAYFALFSINALASPKTNKTR